MQTKTITIKVPVLSNPLNKINKARKDLKIKFLQGLMAAQYAKGDTVGAYLTFHKIKNV